MEPDLNTKKRLEYLAKMGEFLFLISDNNGEVNDYYSAKESLFKFKEEIDLLNLEPKTRSGINYFIKYMDTKIAKRMSQAGATT